MGVRACVGIRVAADEGGGGGMGVGAGEVEMQRVASVVSCTNPDLQTHLQAGPDKMRRRLPYELSTVSVTSCACTPLSS